VALTGAGISRESGIPTFRGRGGFWEGTRPEELATPRAFFRDPEKVWRWYCWRREIISRARPNRAHEILAKMEREHQLWIITQNVDGLHQRAGSRRVIELHGNIWRLKCTSCGRTWEDPGACGKIPPRCPRCGALARPDVVWFGESLPTQALRKSFELAEWAEVFLVVGTSGLVQPAAELPFIAKGFGARVMVVNPERTPHADIAEVFIQDKATSGMEKVYELLQNKGPS